MSYQWHLYHCDKLDSIIMYWFEYWLRLDETPNKTEGNFSNYLQLHYDIILMYVLQVCITLTFHKLDKKLIICFNFPICLKLKTEIFCVVPSMALKMFYQSKLQVSWNIICENQALPMLYLSIQAWDSFHWWHFCHNSNAMKIWFCSQPNYNQMIAIKFYTWHDSYAVVACAEICCNLMTRNWITLQQNFHRIWIVSKNKHL